MSQRPATSHHARAAMESARAAPTAIAHRVPTSALWLAAAAAIVGGYVDLWRGGEDVAAVLLVLGYVVLVPLALLHRAWRAEPRRADAGAVPRPTYAAAALAALALFALYLATLAPATALWDASEYIGAASILGLPHPPGNPFFILVGHVFGLLPVAESYARRINILAALASATAAFFWFLIAERVLARWLEHRWQQLTGAALAVLVGGTAFTVWNQSVVNEKVYTVALALVAIVSWLAVRWADAPTGPRADSALVLCVYLLGLGYTNHPAGFLPAPALVVVVLAVSPAVLLRWRLLAVGGGALVLGLTLFLYEPIRAANFPDINAGAPTACTMRIGVRCTFSALTVRRVVDNVSRAQYGSVPLLQRQAPFPDQVGMWWLYFKWQWLRDVAGAYPAAQLALAVVFLALGLLGGAEHWRRDRPSFWYFGPLVATVTAGLIFYLNFKLGYTQAAQRGLAFDIQTTEVRDRDYFYLWGFSVWGVWVALGLVSVWEALARRLASLRGWRGTRGAPLPRAWAVAAPVLALALVPLVANLRAASRTGQTFPREWAVDLLNSVEPYGILITNGDNDTFPLWYAQETERIRRDVTVLVTSYLNLDWFVRQLIRSPVPAYDSARGPAIYRDRSWTRPTGAPLRLTMNEADSLPPYVQLPQPMRFVSGGISATVPAGYLTRDQIIVLRMIADAFPQRPMYFSAAIYPIQLGLGRYVVQEGLAYKLMPTVPAPGPSMLEVPGQGWLDVQGSLARWQMYRGPSALLEQGRWVDRPSVDIPARYAYTGMELAAGLQQVGDTTRAAAVAATATAIADIAGLR